MEIQILPSLQDLFDLALELGVISEANIPALYALPADKAVASVSYSCHVNRHVLASLGRAQGLPPGQLSRDLHAKYKQVWDDLRDARLFFESASCVH